MTRHTKKTFFGRHKMFLTGVLCLFAVSVFMQNTSYSQNNMLYAAYQERLSSTKSLQIGCSPSLEDTHSHRSDSIAEKTDALKKNVPDSIRAISSPGLSGAADTVSGAGHTDKKKHIFVEHMDLLSYRKEFNPDAQILRGNVVFRQDGSYMYCDSAYYFENNNSLEAFGNVRMEQGDTLFIYGNYLYYDGNTQLAKLRENVRMENNQMTLFTDSLNYDRIANLGYYFDGGLLVDEENELSSFYGNYSPATKMAIFNDSVRLENPRFTLYSDTLEYDTQTKIATILGPSTIVSDSGTVYSSHGWFNTMDNTVILLDRSKVWSGSKMLTGDSIYFNRDLQFGEAFGNMAIQDTLQKVILAGNYGYYNDSTGYAFATDSALAIEYSQQDSLFIHGDTLKMETVDSTYREIKAYYGVRFYRTDLQGVCDSMQFNTKDSILYMYKDPVLWNQQNQLYGDTILIYMNDSTIDFAHVKQFAFVVQEVKPDSVYFNQLKGNDLKAYFDNGTIRQIDIAGNVETIYFPLEGDGAMVGMNYTKSSYFTMWLKDSKLEKLKQWPVVDGTLTPIPDIDPAQKTLKDFYWFNYLRPKNKFDIFNVVKRKVQDAPKKSNKFVNRQ